MVYLFFQNGEREIFEKNGKLILKNNGEYEKTLGNLEELLARNLSRYLNNSENTPSIRKIAAIIGKSPSTVMRWQTTNPELYKAVAEYADKHYPNKQ